MVKVIFIDLFRKKFTKIKDNSIKNKIIKQIEKIEENPELGKPMKYSRKGSRELYVSPYRLSYRVEGDKVYILDIYHKDLQ